MTDPRWLDDREMAAWMPLIKLIHLLPQALDRQLRDEVGIGHSYYSMLASLSDAPERTLPMGELARYTATSPSRLSHAISVMEERGWVQRKPSPSDRRIQYATLTAAGLEVLRKVAPSHVAEVRRLIFDRLDPEQVDQLRDLGTVLLDGLDGPGAAGR
ncbi:MarR family winged helix-turn-helix transcriptional regulator [Nocardia harenae]|uniref:MarR family winged helix-turn-helix transcriptional regulator n=1 Tax=Nocardia harenae TaxID=358707 RepID=UPI00083214C9|nr:MarR family winged helix-turn-helix transcriptional regulator [Nocardia harenae]